MKKIIIILILLSASYGQTVFAQTHILNIQQELPQTEIQIYETLTDTIYKNKNYKIVQQHFPNVIDTISDNNMIVHFFSNNEMIYQDTIYSFTGEIEFQDFNGDNVKDILVQNISDVRSNWTYYLFLVDTVNDNMKKIKGFEKIKNPNYMSKYNLIHNYVISGENWTSFYQIQNDTIRDFNIAIYDNSTYDREYKRAIANIKAQEIDMDFNDLQGLYERLNSGQPLPEDSETFNYLQQYIQDSLIIHKTFTDKNGNNNLEIKVINPCYDPVNSDEYPRFDGWINYMTVSLENNSYTDTLIYYNPSVAMTLINLQESDIAIRTISNKEAVFICFEYCGTQDPEESLITCIVLYNNKKYLFNITRSNAYIANESPYYERYKIVDNLSEKLKELPNKLRKELIKYIKFRYESTMLQ